MLKRTVKFIHNLRIYFFVLIIISFFYSLGVNPVDISQFVGAKLGQAIGMSVSVPENPFNKLAVQLAEKENRLNQKEADLLKKESELNRANGDNNSNNLLYALTGGIIILFILILANYYLDYKRKKKESLLFIKK